MQSIAMLNVAMPSVVTLGIVMLNVVAPRKRLYRTCPPMPKRTIFLSRLANTIRRFDATQISTGTHSCGCSFPEWKLTPLEIIFQKPKKIIKV
jgi:hypothetical protein